MPHSFADSTKDEYSSMLFHHPFGSRALPEELYARLHTYETQDQRRYTLVATEMGAA
jgi:hypothetical protein